LLIRIALAVFFGILLMRFFYPQASILSVVGLIAVLVGLSYLTEYLRRRKKKS
jgi:uncharacterized membrane protein